MAEQERLQQLLEKTRQQIPALGFLESQLAGLEQAPPPDAPEFRYYLILLVNKLIEVEAAMAEQPEEVRTYFQETVWKGVQQKKTDLVRRFFSVFAKQFSETQPSIVPEVRLLDKALHAAESLEGFNGWTVLERLHQAWQAALAADIPQDWHILTANNEQIFPPTITEQSGENLKGLILTAKEAQVKVQMEALLSSSLAYSTRQLKILSSTVSNMDSELYWQTYTKEDLMSLREEISSGLQELFEQTETYVALYPRLGIIVHSALEPIRNALSQLNYYIGRYPYSPPARSTQEVRPPEREVPQKPNVENKDKPILDLYGNELYVGWTGLYQGIYPNLKQSNPRYVLADVTILEIPENQGPGEKQARIKILSIRKKGSQVNMKVGEVFYASGYELGTVRDILVNPGNPKKRR